MLIFNSILVDHADFARVKWSYVLMGNRHLIEIARFTSQAELELSGDIFIRKGSQNQGKQKNVRDSKEFKLKGSRDFEFRLYHQLTKFLKNLPFQKFHIGSFTVNKHDITWLCLKKKET